MRLCTLSLLLFPLSILAQSATSASEVSPGEGRTSSGARAPYGRGRCKPKGPKPSGLPGRPSENAAPSAVSQTAAASESMIPPPVSTSLAPAPSDPISALAPEPTSEAPAPESSSTPPTPSNPPVETQPEGTIPSPPATAADPTKTSPHPPVLPPVTTGVGAGGEQADFIAAHNTWRAKYGAAPVTWNTGAAAQAEANVLAHRDSCKLEHTVNGKFGENLMGGPGGNGIINANGVVGWWMTEAPDFDYSDPDGQHGGKVVGHFQAVVWTAVTQIGCAAGKCGADGTYIACCYYADPAIKGEVPRPL